MNSKETAKKESIEGKRRSTITGRGRNKSLKTGDKCRKKMVQGQSKLLKIKRTDGKRRNRLRSIMKKAWKTGGKRYPWEGNIPRNPQNRRKRVAK